MSETNETEIKVAESIGVVMGRAKRFILETHPELRLCDEFGREIAVTSEYPFGILRNTPLPILSRRSWWERLLKPEPLHARPFIGMIKLDNKEGPGNPKKWLIEIYGRENVQLFLDLDKELREKFSVGIHLRLQEEKERLELPVGSDFYYSPDDPE